ncbi:MAG: poly(R)-hydroxyalkanoic acid synthase subunit PhaE [Pseudomonadota bacterium]
MTESNNNPGFEALAELWQESQEAFAKAQQEIGEQFQRSLNEMAGTVKHEAADPLAAWQAMIKAWVPGFDMSKSTTPSWPPNLDFRQGQSAFFELLDPQRWTNFAPEQLRVMLERIAHGPQFADLAMPQQKVAEAWRESLDYQQAASDMSRVMQNAWTEAYQSFSKHYSLDDLRKGEVNEAMDGWLKAANEALLAAQGSTEFLDAQKRMIRASTELRARQRDMAEDWSEAWQMPTRSEVDDLARMVHQLRRELREVKRELVKVRGEQK